MVTTNLIVIFLFVIINITLRGRANGTSSMLLLRQMFRLHGHTAISISLYTHSLHFNAKITKNLFAEKGHFSILRILNQIKFQNWGKFVLSIYGMLGIDWEASLYFSFACMRTKNSKELQEAHPAKEDQYLCPVLITHVLSAILLIIDNKILILMKFYGFYALATHTIHF